TAGTIAGIAEIVGAIAALIPQVTSPTVIGAEASTGGLTAATVVGHVAGASRSAAAVFDWQSRAAGTQATFERREQEWRQQIALAKKEVAQQTAQAEAASIRIRVAERSKEVHEKTIEQTREIYDFQRSKFSSLGLFTWLSTQLNRYHRMAFDTAM